MKKVMVVGAISVAAIVMWRGFGSGEREDAQVSVGDTELVFDRLWIDHLPKNERDTIKIFVAVTEEPLGVFQSASKWQGAYELFKYEAHDGEVRAVFPQKGDREKFTVAASKCTNSRMDYCLEIKGASRGTKHYYSMKGWEIGRTERTLLDQVDQLTRQLPVE